VEENWQFVEPVALTSMAGLPLVRLLQAKFYQKNLSCIQNDATWVVRVHCLCYLAAVTALKSPFDEKGFSEIDLFTPLSYLFFPG